MSAVNLVVLVLLAVAFLIVIQRNLLNLNDFLRKETPGMFKGFKSLGPVCSLCC